MDYSKIKEEYETTKTSFKQLSDKYKIHYKKLQRVAKKEGWIKYRPNPKNKPQKPHKSILTPQIITDTQSVEDNIKTLLKTNLYPIDEVLILTYIDSYQSFLALQEDIKTEGKFLNSTKGNIYMNPKYSALQMEKMNLIKIGKELGITLSARTRLNLIIEEENKEPTVFDKIQALLRGDIPIDEDSDY